MTKTDLFDQRLSLGSWISEAPLCALALTFAGVGLLYAPSNVQAQGSGETTTPLQSPSEGSSGHPSAPAGHDWVPPRDDNFDWVQLKSGEWLKGEILSMRDESMEFDSDELDQLKLDWGDIKSVYANRSHRWVLEDLSAIEGTGVVRSGAFVVEGQDGPQTFTRKQLYSVIDEADSEPDRWSAKLSLGMDLYYGNTRQVTLTGMAKIVRRSDATRLTLDYNGSFSRVRDATTANVHRGTVGLDLFVSRKFYFTVPWLSAVYDELQNIRARVTAGAGGGYRIFDKGPFEWEVGLGAAYQYLQFLSVQPGTDETENNLAIIPSTDFEWDITSDIEFDGSYRAEITVTDIGRTAHHAKAMFSFDLTDILEFEFTLFYDRVEEPVTRADGTTPVSDDVQLVFGLGLDVG